jgi:hypothetical protein
LPFADVVSACHPIKIDPVKEEAMRNLRIESPESNEHPYRFKKIEYGFRFIFGNVLLQGARRSRTYAAKPLS